MLWLVNPTMCLSLLCPCGHVVALDHLAALVMVMWLPTPIYCHDLRVALSAYNCGYCQGRWFACWWVLVLAALSRTLDSEIWPLDASGSASGAKPELEMDVAVVA